MDDNMLTLHFGEALRVAREARGVTRAELAYEAGVAANTLYRLETGKTPHQFRLDSAAWLAHYLGLPLSDLLPETF